ncbi:MAG: RluA family pseudouridine synthase, partial [candidate division KSB1 bacterium]|nr:RluA family pseudouridine synthase [candidate division KSB1 bacterium]
MNPPITILYEDEAVLAINKPAHLLVIPDRWDPNKSNLFSILQRRYPEHKIYVVHRLDEGTSGLVLFAKTPEAHRHLCQQLQQRRMAKTYLAIVIGEVERDGVVDLAMGADRRKKGKMAVQNQGKESVTEYQILERYRGFTYLKVMPKTGRTHQIRLHLQAIGHPLAVDPVYGERQAIYLSELKPRYKQKPDAVERPLIDRLTLHAAEIRFAHPITG